MFKSQVVLAGWPGYVPFQFPMEPPKPASLEPLFKLAGIDQERMEDAMDTLYQLYGALTPTRLLRGQALRPLVHAAFASQLMYFPERMRWVLNIIVYNVFGDIFICNEGSV